MTKYLLALLLFAPLAASACGDNEYGCTVALCVANPGGPTQFVECQSCVDRLRADLRHGKGWPSCNNVQYGVQQWEHCATVYQDYQKDINGGAWCGLTAKTNNLSGNHAWLPAMKPGRSVHRGKNRTYDYQRQAGKPMGLPVLFCGRS